MSVNIQQSISIKVLVGQTKKYQVKFYDFSDNLADPAEAIAKIYNAQKTLLETINFTGNKSSVGVYWFEKDWNTEGQFIVEVSDGVGEKSVFRFVVQVKFL
jgi:hypothetical protein